MEKRKEEEQIKEERREREIEMSREMASQSDTKNPSASHPMMAGWDPSGFVSS